VAVVTGAARGLGRVIAATLAREGCTLVLADVTDCAATAAEVTALGGRVWPSRTDVSCETDVLALAAEPAAERRRLGWDA
jgi:NAD(P)-dependent dehydrogenase (short-subunit alcohol dehydrogenase family)